jgi:hypothetical protein
LVFGRCGGDALRNGFNAAYRQYVFLVLLKKRGLSAKATPFRVFHLFTLYVKLVKEVILGAKELRKAKSLQFYPQQS